MIWCSNLTEDDHGETEAGAVTGRQAGQGECGTAGEAASGSGLSMESFS